MSSEVQEVGRRNWSGLLRVLVAGQGYVGLPMSMRAVEAGHTVIGIEPNNSRLDRLISGDSYVEDVPSDQLKRALGSGRYSAVSALPHDDVFDVAIITVPTPLLDRAPDLSYVAAAADQVGRALTSGSLVVLESTTYPGTTEEVVVPLLESRSGLRAGRDFHVAYSPERIDPGNTTWDFRNTPKVVAGLNAESLAAATAFYSSIVDTVVPVRGLREAELTKILENTFRHVNIGLINEFAILAHALDIDIWETIEAAATKPFGFMKFTPGPGVGGHCLPVDPSYLSWRVEQVLGTSFRFVHLANDINDQMPKYAVQRVSAMLNRSMRSVNGSRVLLVGLAYKAGTGDIRESPALDIARSLRALGAEVSAFDPLVDALSWPADLERVTSLAASDRPWNVCVVVTNHDNLPHDEILRTCELVLDTRHVMTGPSVEYL